MNLKATLYLANGASVPVLLGEDFAEDEADAVDAIRNLLTGDERPGWRRLDNVVFFSQAISAVQVEEL